MKEDITGKLNKIALVVGWIVMIMTGVALVATAIPVLFAFVEKMDDIPIVNIVTSIGFTTLFLSFSVKSLQKIKIGWGIFWIILALAEATGPVLHTTAMAMR